MAINPGKYDIRRTDSSLDRIRFRVEHWLLSPGRTDTGRLRGYRRVKEWRDCDSWSARLRMLKVAAKTPLRALRDSWAATGQYGVTVEREHGVSRRRQLAQLWWIWMRHGVHPEVYYAFRLYRPGQLRRAPSFFQHDEDDQSIRLVNLHTAPDEANMMLDKVAFERWLAEKGLPTVRTVLELSGGEVTRSSLVDGHLPHADLFSKPNDALQGVGTRKWIHDGDGWIGDEGRMSEDELLTHLMEASREQDILVQERLRNHSAMAPLAPNALSTIRVLTLRGLDGAIRVIVAVCKIPTGAAPTDHMRLGGIAAPVDLATGRLGQGLGKSKVSIVEPVERHPDTGVTIEGFQIPMWDEVIRLSVRAHEALERLVCVGWDVAVLDDGPVIIEGNDNPGHTSSQLPTGIAMGETEVVPTLVAHLQVAFAQAPASAMAGARTVGLEVQATE